TILLILAYLALFLSVSTLLRTRPRRKLFVGTVLVSAVAQILISVLSRTAGAEGDDKRLSGPFSNPNHFAGYLEIALVLAFSPAWTQVLVSTDHIPPTADDG